MSGKIKLLIVALVLILGGGLAAAFGDTRGPEPELVCVSENGPTSGFTDSSQGDCPVSIESFNEWSDWYSAAQPVKGVGVIVAGVGIVLAGGVGVTALVQKSRKNRP